MTTSIFITAANPSGYPIGSTQAVSDSTAFFMVGSNQALYSSTRNPEVLAPQQAAAVQVAAPGGGGSTTWASLTDKATANLQADNAPLAAALAALAPLPPNSALITGSNALTHALHANRQLIIADAGNTTQTLNNDATGGWVLGETTSRLTTEAPVPSPLPRVQRPSTLAPGVLPRSQRIAWGVPTTSTTRPTVHRQPGAAPHPPPPRRDSRLSRRSTRSFPTTQPVPRQQTSASR